MVHNTQGNRNVDQAVPTRDVLQPKKGKSFARRGKISCGRTTQKRGSCGHHWPEVGSVTW
jgi:hypothetical protein